MALRILHEFGGTWLFFWNIIHTTWHTPGNWRAVNEQILLVTSRSISTVLFAGIFIGAILVLQFQVMLGRFDAIILLGGLNTSATIREVGPLIISFLLAGKIGAYTTAELANMRVTEQIDAVECLGTNPLQYLVVPRFFAIIYSSVLLLVAGLAISVIGSLLVATTSGGMNAYQYISSIPRFAGAWTIFEGLFRCTLFSTIVATVCTFKGYTASGGAKGVGKAVTESAIFTNVYIVLANFASSSVLEWFHHMLWGYG
jgi:phospholipid/cholesterol/gamma-HCH transport system permease protein